MALGDICRVENCEKLVTKKGSKLCSMHRHRWERHRTFDDPIRTKNLICTIDGCEKEAIGKKLCDMHKARFDRNGHYDIVRNFPKKINEITKFCEIHGQLSLDAIYLEKGGKYCRQCRNKKNKDRKFIILDPSVTERKCGCCKEVKPTDSFSPQQNTQRWPICKMCRVNYASVHRAKHKHHYKKWYNLTKDQFNEILKSQNYRCYICNRTADEAQPGRRNKRENNLAVDHCHRLEKEGIMAIRGLLCFSCNAALGKFNDDVILLTKAIQYLDREPVLITKK